MSVSREGFRCHVGVFWWPLGQFDGFLTILDKGLEVDDFSRDALGNPRLRLHAQGSGNTPVPGPSRQLLSAQFADLQTARSRYQIGKLANADCWTGRTRRLQLQTHASQPGGPSNEGPADFPR